MLLSILAILPTIGIHSLTPPVTMQTAILLGQRFSRSTIHRLCLEVIQMAMGSTAHLRRSIQVVSTHQILFTVPTLRDLRQDPIQIRAVLQSRTVVPLDNHIPSTNILTILDHTVKGDQDILQELILTTMKVATLCLQTLHIPLVSLFTAHLLRLGHTPVHTPLPSSSGLQVNSLSKILMEILCVHLILLHGQGLALVPHHHTSPRSSVHHLLDQNPKLPQLLPMENLQR